MDESAGHQPRPSRSIRPAAVAALTLLGFVLCAVMAYPFLPALAWAVALAVMAFPVHSRIERFISNSNLAASCSTALVVAVILFPILLVSWQLCGETAHAAATLTGDGKLEAAVARAPYGPESLAWIQRNVDVEGETRRLLAGLSGGASFLARGSAWFAVQALICIFVLFFAFRDWRHLLKSVENLSPLTRAESDYLFTRVADSIHATVYATVATSVIQGVTGGLLFWLLGIPGTVLWGVVMTILGIIPLVGAGLVWVPAAAILVFEDRWGSAVALIVWGLVMGGPVGNWLYARLAGERMRLHPVPVLLSFVGGLAVFGVSGMVIGPVVLAVTIGLSDIWKSHYRSESPLSPSTSEASIPATNRAD